MNHLIFNTPLVSGKTNSTILKISKLQNKKYRNEEKLFICDGIKLFLEAYDFNAEIRYIVINNNTDFPLEIQEKIKKCQKQGTSVICVDECNFKKLTTENAPQGIITVCEYLYNNHSFINFVENIENDEKILVLESVRDPGNIGTILRNAVAFGIDRLIITSDCVDIYSPKVVRSSMGAIFKLNMDIIENITKTIDCLKKHGRRVLGTALGKDSLVLGKDQITKNDVFVLGNEGHGLCKETIEHCTDTLFIPIQKNTESLNVSIASAILMWEISK
ncbi:MAG: RNA methyltransferase [Clostridia bacterium]|nr:RNA methyltransferase [Clostridia bacterium]